MKSWRHTPCSARRRPLGEARSVREAQPAKNVSYHLHQRSVPIWKRPKEIGNAIPGMHARQAGDVALGDMVPSCRGVAKGCHGKDVVVRIGLAYGPVGEIGTFVEAAQQSRIERLHDQHCKTHEIIRAQAARLANIHVAGRPIDVEHPCERHRVMTHREIRVEIDGSTDLLDGLIDVVPQQECAAQSPITLRVARVEK